MTCADAIGAGESVSTVPESKTAFAIRNMIKKRVGGGSCFYVPFMFNIIQKNTIQIVLKHDFLLRD